VEQGKSVIIGRVYRNSRLGVAAGCEKLLSNGQHKSELRVIVRRQHIDCLLFIHVHKAEIRKIGSIHEGRA